MCPKCPNLDRTFWTPTGHSGHRPDIPDIPDTHMKKTRIVGHCQTIGLDYHILSQQLDGCWSDYWTTLYRQTQHHQTIGRPRAKGGGDRPVPLQNTCSQSLVTSLRKKIESGTNRTGLRSPIDWCYFRIFPAYFCMRTNVCPPSQSNVYESIYESVNGQ